MSIAIRIWASQGLSEIKSSSVIRLQYRGEEEVMTPNEEEDLR